MDTVFSFKKMDNLTKSSDIIGVIAAIITPEYKILFENSKCKKIHGKNLGRNCYNIYANPSREFVCENCPVQAVFKYGEVAKEEFSSYDLDGNEIFIEVVASPIRNENGKIIASIETVRDLTARKKAEKEKEDLIKDLQNAFSELRILRGVLPICMYCKKIRDDKGSWNQLEKYITENSSAQFSHGICDKCLNKYYPEYME